MEQRANPEPGYAWRALELFTKYGDDEAIVAGDWRLTYRDLRAGALGMAQALHGHGVRPGSGIGVLVGNPPEAALLQFGAHLLGCRTAWITPDAPRHHLADFLRLAEVDSFGYDARAYPVIGEEMARAVPEPKVLCLGPGGAGPDLLADAARWPALADLPASAAGLPAPPCEPEIILQTSGTTDRPKLVHHGPRFYRALMELSEEYLASGEPRLRHLAVSWLCHISGQVAAMMTVFTGGTWYPLDRFDAAGMLRTIERERITSVFFLPPQLYRVLDHPLVATTDMSSLAMISVGGAAAAPSRLAQAIRAFGPVLRPVYGATEAAFVTALPELGSDPSRVDLLSSCGQPYGDARIEIRDEHGTVLPPGEAGEVWVAGALTMAGYWGEPEQTKEDVVDGWVRTGDIGYLNPEGYLFLVDRIKDSIMIGLSTLRVYSRPIEDSLVSHPNVRAAAVIGVQHDTEGEAVYAYVVPARGTQVTLDELRSRVYADLGQEWVPWQVEFMDDLPLTEVGKVDKKALRARYQARVRDAAS